MLVYSVYRLLLHMYGLWLRSVVMSDMHVLVHTQHQRVWRMSSLLLRMYGLCLRHDMLTMSAWHRHDVQRHLSALVIKPLIQFKSILWKFCSVSFAYYVSYTVCPANCASCRDNGAGSAVCLKCSAGYAISKTGACQSEYRHVTSIIFNDTTNWVLLAFEKNTKLIVEVIGVSQRAAHWHLPTVKTAPTSPARLQYPSARNVSPDTHSRRITALLVPPASVSTVTSLGISPHAIFYRSLHLVHSLWTFRCKECLG